MAKKLSKKKRITKCPECGEELHEDNRLLIEQNYTTSIKGYMDADGEVDYDLDAGYTDLWEWTDAMLVEEGKPEILGCEECAF